MDLKSRIRTVPDFPKPGIGFKDITTLLADPAAFAESLRLVDDGFPPSCYDVVLGIEARGFIFGAALAHAHAKAFAPARKPGKLPWETIRRSYELEYGSDSLEVHADACAPGQRALVVDDLLATGGTLAACLELVRELGAEPAGAVCVVELDFLDGRRRVEALGVPLLTLVHYGAEEE